MIQAFKGQNLFKVLTLSFLVLFSFLTFSTTEASTDKGDKRGFEVTSTKVEIYPNEFTEIAKVNVTKQKQDRYLNSVNLQFKATKKAKTAKPWETFSSIDYVHNGQVVHVVDIGQKSDWKKSKVRGKETWMLNAFSGNVKIAAGTNPQLKVNIRTQDKAPVGERWVVESAKKGIVIWTAKDGHKSYSLPKNIVTIDTK